MKSTAKTHDESEQGSNEISWVRVRVRAGVRDYYTTTILLLLLLIGNRGRGRGRDRGRDRG